MGDKDSFDEKEGAFLIDVARKTIENELFNKNQGILPDHDLHEKFLKKRGTFVTLTRNGNLRGCIGHIVPHEPLIESIKNNAVAAAFRDPRFPPLQRDEWKDVDIEVSVLTDPQPLSYSDAEDLLQKLRPGIDGVIIQKGYHSATFLPQVWKQLPDKETFLNHLCMKAGLPADAWKNGDLAVLTYQVQAFEE